jgi:hypothetical protein
MTWCAAYLCNARRLPKPPLSKRLGQEIMSLTHSSATEDPQILTIYRRYLLQVLSCPRYGRRPSREDIQWAKQLIKSVASEATYKHRLNLINQTSERLETTARYRPATDLQQELIKIVFGGDGGRFAEVAQLKPQKAKALLLSLLEEKREEVIDQIRRQFHEQDAEDYAKAALSHYIDPREIAARLLKRRFGK